jgi:phosphoenolpyruvate mutase
MKNKIVYVGLTADPLHHGHINIIREASKLGDLYIGLLTDSAIAPNKRLPFLTWHQRKKIVENIVGVKMVIAQDEWDYAPTIRTLKPDIMVHGTDWLDGPLAPFRARALEALGSYGGDLVEIPYTKDVSSSAIQSFQFQNGILGEVRTNSLKRLIVAKDIVRILEAHNPLSGILVEESFIDVNGIRKEFDGMWSSSLTDSTSRGLPDTEALSLNWRINNISDIFAVTTKPLIIDADTGGQIDHFELAVRQMDKLGISACIIEDKKGLKRNSLLGNSVEQTIEDPKIFSKKIEVGRNARINPNFMVIARIESLILDRGIDDAIERAFLYTDAGADGIMIHSRMTTPNETFEFAEIYRKKFPDVPLVIVPTTFNSVNEQQLVNVGFNVVIYANHMLRAAVPAMRRAAEGILRNGRSKEIEGDIEKMSSILSLIPGTSQ